MLRRYSGIIILALFIAAIFAPVDVPYSLESVAKVIPARQWILTKRLDGSLTVTLHDNRTGQLQEAEGYQFDRGDLVQMQFGNADSSGLIVKKGAVVATILSNRLDEQIVQLKNQLQVELANREVVATGEKQELIRQLTEELNLARENLKLQKKTYDRAKALVADGVIAQAEWEQAENAHDAAIVQVKVAEEALTVATTGEKAETVSQAASRIQSLQQQIAFLENKQQRYLLTAPFEGTLRTENTPDGDRIVLEDTSASILIIPIRLRDSRFVQPGQEIDLKFPDNQQTFTSFVLETSTQVALLGRDQVVTVKAMTKEKNLPAGMPLRCTINCGNVRIIEFLKRSIIWR
ncbi:MAG: hypothetical protein H6563_08055 [Lewinellaceae bacterium]|nr:hypothetical protein [Lewinellaceae bacterium]